MTRKFELRREVVLHASPDQVWNAIATSPGLEGGSCRWTLLVTALWSWGGSQAGGSLSRPRQLEAGTSPGCAY
jgi:hypothetical protein